MFFVKKKTIALLSSKAWESFAKHRRLVFWKKLSTIEVFSRCQMVTRLHSCCSESMLKYSNRQNTQMGGSPQIHTICIQEKVKVLCIIYDHFIKYHILNWIGDYSMYCEGVDVIMRKDINSIRIATIYIYIYIYIFFFLFTFIYICIYKYRLLYFFN